MRGGVRRGEREAHEEQRRERKTNDDDLPRGARDAMALHGRLPWQVVAYGSLATRSSGCDGVAIAYGGAPRRSRVRDYAPCDDLSSASDEPAIS